MNLTRGRVVLYFGAIIAVAFALRLPSLLVNFVNIDENEYALAAHILNGGGIPYRDFLIYQPPAIYYLYAATFKFFPHLEMADKMWWVHFAMILVVILSCWAIYRIAKVIDNNRIIGYFSSLFYAIFSTTFLPQDMLGANIELVMVLPMTLSVYFFLKGERRFSYYFLSGIFLGLTILTKYQGGILFGAFAIYLFFVRPFWRGFFPLAAIVVSTAGAVACWAAYLKGHGAWEDTSRCFFYILQYAKGPAGSDFIYVTLKFLMRTAMMALAGFVLWYFGSRSVWRILRHWRETASAHKFLVLWLIACFVPVVIGGRIYFHYYLLLFPPLSLLAGQWWKVFFDRIRQMPFEKGAWRLMWFFVAVFIPVTGFTAYATYKPFRPKHKDYWIYTVDYLRERTKAGDKIFVWGYCPQIYTMSNRMPATRFTTADYLTGRTPKTAGLEFDPASPNPPSVWTKLKRDFGTPSEVIHYDTSDNIFPGAWELLKADFEKNPPEVIIDTSPSNYRMYGRYPIAKFPYLKEFVKKNYRFEAAIQGMDLYRLQNPK